MAPRTFQRIQSRVCLIAFFFSFLSGSKVSSTTVSKSCFFTSCCVYRLCQSRMAALGIQLCNIAVQSASRGEKHKLAVWQARVCVCVCVCVCALTRLMCIICRLNLRLVQIHRLGFLEEAPDSKSMEACLRSDLPRHRPGAGGFRYLADVAWQYEVDDTTVCRIGQTLEQEAAAFAVQLEVKLITPGDSR